MCNFFSFVTEPEKRGGERFYFNWEQRKRMNFEGQDSHDHIVAHYKLPVDLCNCYEYNPLTKEFIADKICNDINDKVQAEEWVTKLDFGKVVKPLIIKPIVHPFKLPKVKRVSDEAIELLKSWASIRASIRASVWASVWASVGASVRDSIRASVWASVWASVGASVWDSIRDSVWASVGAYISTFFDVKYKHDFSACAKLWEMGLVPSFDGTTWRLHSGENADVVYEWKP